MNLRKISILIVDDHQLIIDGLKALLNGQDLIRIEAGFPSGPEALQWLRDHTVDVVLADINMPVMNGIELTRQIRTLCPDTAVLALTMHNDGTLISRMIEAGASGYIIKSSGIDELTEAIQTVAAGGKFLSREAQSVIMQRIYSAHDAIASVSPDAVMLTPRETEILKLIAHEFSNEQIAAKLFISERTVETHRKNIFIKTGTKTIVGLIKYAMENHLLE